MKDHGKRMKRQDLYREKNICKSHNWQNHIIQQKVVSSVYKGHLKLSNEWANEPVKKKENFWKGTSVELNRRHKHKKDAQH